MGEKRSHKFKDLLQKYHKKTSSLECPLANTKNEKFATNLPAKTNKKFCQKKVSLFRRKLLSFSLGKGKLQPFCGCSETCSSFEKRLQESKWVLPRALCKDLINRRRTLPERDQCSLRVESSRGEVQGSFSFRSVSVFRVVTVFDSKKESASEKSASFCLFCADNLQVFFVRSFARETWEELGDSRLGQRSAQRKSEVSFDARTLSIFYWTSEVLHRKKTRSILPICCQLRYSQSRI